MTRFGIGSVLKAGLSDSIPSVLVSHIALASSNSILSDQISRERPQWPLLLLSHGLTGTPEIYSTYGEQLASLGFIVIAPAHTDGSCSESYLQVNDVWESRHKQLNQRVKDMQSILDELQASQDPPLRSLASRINFSTVGICGHSFGGATAAQLLQKDSRVASGISWDGWMFPLSTPSTAHNTKPFLFINSDGFHWEENILHMRQWCAHNASGGHIVTLKGTNHHNFNDLPFLGHPSIIKWVSKNTSGWFGESDPLQATKIAVSLAAAFFARVFQTDSPPSPSHLRATIRECILEHTSKVIVDYIPPSAEWRPDLAESARTPNRPKQGAIMSHSPSHTL
jgi:dienelactone hydrolase